MILVKECYILKGFHLIEYIVVYPKISQW